jgi:hypothetical protein
MFPTFAGENILDPNVERLGTFPTFPVKNVPKLNFRLQECFQPFPKKIFWNDN